MDNATNGINGPNQGNSLFSNKNFLIIALIFLLTLSFLGINLITLVGNFLQQIVFLLTPLINQVLFIFGYTSGTVINKTTDVVADTAKGTIDIAGGTLHSIGNLLQNTGTPVQLGSLKIDNSINRSTMKPYSEPKPDTTENPIQKPISSNKTNWCLVGEYEGRRGCIEVGEHAKCLSGQVFPDQKSCLNPTLTNNMTPTPIKK